MELMSLPKPKKLPGRSHLFVSYSRSDRIAVDKLAEDLRTRGYVLWIDVDERGIEPGEDWQNELVVQMSNAEAVLACISPDFLASPYCKAEIEQALNEGKPVYPALVRRLGASDSLEAVKLDRLQYTDLTLDYNVGLRKLLLALPRPQQPFRQLMRTGGFAIGVIGIIALALLGMVIAVRLGTFDGQPTLTPIPPTATPALNNVDIGVVMSYFRVEPAGAMSQSEADAIIERFALALDQRLKSELGRGELTYQIDGPASIPRLDQPDSQSRAQAAAALLESRGAKVAIYGVIRYDATLRQAQLEPEFYVAADQYFNDAQDITGSYAFGKNIPADSIDERSNLGIRITSLSYLMNGLFQHMTRHYDSALKLYKASLDTLTVAELDDGKEIIYTLIGNSEMKLAEQSARACDRASVLEHADAAASAYQSSQQIADEFRPDFPRAYAGLANVYAVRALWLPEGNDGCASSSLNLEALQQAAGYIDGYRAKLNPLTEDPGVQRKLLLTEVQVRFLLWAVQDKAARDDPENPLFRDFQRVVEQIVAGYTARGDSTWAFPVMEAHIFYGQALYAKGLFRDALAHYKEALNVYNNGNPALLSPERAMTAYGFRGDALMRLKDYPAAGQAYDEALQIARATNNTAAIESYTARQKLADESAQATPQPEPTASPEANEPED
jgi:tetratricopeptide (TPR) repeat protein